MWLLRVPICINAVKAHFPDNGIENFSYLRFEARCSHSSEYFNVRIRKCMLNERGRRKRRCSSCNHIIDNDYTGRDKARLIDYFH